MNGWTTPWNKKVIYIGKTTMSVREMRKLLGLGKTESYWLVHQGFFETIMVNGKMRVVIDSFEYWYSMQIKHRKVTGEEPGTRLREESYSVQEISAMLGVCKDQALYLIKQAKLPVFKVHCQFQVPKHAFNDWYANQNHYVLTEEKAASLEGGSYMTLPQMAQRLGVSRDTVYSIVGSRRGKSMLKIVTVGDRQYVEMDSFKHWLDSQEKYGLDKGSQIRKKADAVKAAKGHSIQLRKPKNPAYYSVEEICRFYGIKQSELYAKLNSGAIPAIRTGHLWRIKRDEFDKILTGRSED